MDKKIVTENGVNIAVVRSGEALICDAQSALDFMVTISYNDDCNCIAIYKEVLAEEFFTLSNRIAGDVLQKVINYSMKLAIIGDFNVYTSKPLLDFMFECNNGSRIFFVETEAEALKRLSA